MNAEGAIFYFRTMKKMIFYGIKKINKTAK